MHLVIVDGADASLSAAPHARPVDPTAEAAVMVADRTPAAG